VVDSIEPGYEKVDKVKQLESKKSELLNYAKEAILSIQKEITKNEKMVLDCEGCFEHLNNRKNLEKRLEMAESSVKNSIKKIEDYKMNSISLKEQQSLAKKLHLENGKCPVCDSKVDHLNPLFQEKHLVEELSNFDQNIKSVEKEKRLFEMKKNEFLEKLQQTRSAETTLLAHSIKSKDQLDSMKQQIILQKTNIQKIPLTINTGKLLQVASIDSHAKSIYSKIITLQNETKEFDLENFTKLKNSLDEKHEELSNINQELGGVLEKIRIGTEQVKKINLILKELGYVKEYISDLEEINECVFNRDGSVALSLRSWALNTISNNSSEYLDMLSTKIQRIELSEKTRDVSITCYSKNSTFDLDSLSGGEQVCIALALRLGMAQILGASNLNFIILDEPTMHLDEERRKSLVRVLSQLSDITNPVSNSKMQFIIITHDSEIFEDSSVEQIYQFQASESGTIITAV